LDATYILPLRRSQADLDPELAGYLHALSTWVEVIVVDGSPAHVFAAHHDVLPNRVLHVPVDPARQTPNGKVGGVLTGLDHAQHERVVIADDDVRYDHAGLARVVELLSDFAVVRPQNYFDPLPWHARLDTARTLLNRISGGDWPGTLGVRRSYLLRTDGYDGRVLFENLELVRTVQAAGGAEVVPLDLYVRRLPSGTRHFLSQRVRQAYDELARPGRLFLSLSLLPLLSYAARRGRWKWLAGAAGVAIGAAELGRRRAGGSGVFPFECSLLAPIWMLERAVCIWLAVGLRLTRGGVLYRGMVLSRAATSVRELRRRHGSPSRQTQVMSV
jgi:Glycosyl transferase family 21